MVSTAAAKVIILIMKVCSRCRIEKEDSEFRRNRGACRLCLRDDWFPARAKHQAQKNGHKWLISPDDYRVIRAFPCTYCGDPLPKKGIGLDRIDNSKEYTPENVIPCDPWCNTFRGNILSYEEMLTFSSQIKAIKKARRDAGLGHTLEPKHLGGRPWN